MSAYGSSHTPTLGRGEYRSLPRRFVRNNRVSNCLATGSRRVSPTSSLYSRYRNPPSDASFFSDVDAALDHTDAELVSSGDEELTTRSEIESIIHGSENSHFADDEGDEIDIDMALVENDASPHTPRSWVGKKRGRTWGQSEDSDGDDEVEAEVVLDWSDRKGKGKASDKRPLKLAKRHVSKTRPRETLGSVPMQASASLGGITKGISDLRASSTVLALNVQSPESDLSSTFARAPIKPKSPSRSLKKARRNHPKKHDSPSCSVSDDPFLGIPIFQHWKGVGRALRRQATELSDMDISEDENDRYESDATMVSASGMSDGDCLKEESSCPKEALPLAIRPRYEPDQPLSNKQFSALMAKNTRGIYRLSQHRGYPTRSVSLTSTSHLHRSSPTSLLPTRRVISRPRSRVSAFPLLDHLAFATQTIRPGANRYVPSSFEFMTVMPGHMYAAVLNAKRAARIARRDFMKAHNERTKNGAWRAWVGNFAMREHIPPVRMWWLEPQTQNQRTEEAAVESILVHAEPISEPAGTISSGASSLVDPLYIPVPARHARKRSRESTPDSGSTSLPDRQIRRRIEVEPYNASSLSRRRALSQARTAAQLGLEEMLQDTMQAELAGREARAYAAAQAERRHDEEIRIRRAQEEEDERLARQLAELESEGANSQVSSEVSDEAPLLSYSRASSPAISEMSIRSDPPDYEPPIHSLGPLTSVSFAPNLPFVRHVAHRPRPRTPPQPVEQLPSYSRDRWTAASPPPPPPYNAQTDRDTVIGPRFVLDEEDGRGREDEEVYEFGGSLRNPAVVRRHSPEPPMPSIVGAFPPHRYERVHRVIAPVPRRPNVDSVRVFEAAADLEEGQVEDEVWDEEDEEEAGEQPVGALQRVLRFVWGRH